jgi:3-phenylpropionate/trans-cinnamate dioxygenase ferredoxin reductase subunit
MESARLPLLTALGAEAAETFAALHREHGVDLRLETDVTSVAATGVTLADGSTLSADTVLVAVGAAPNIELAERAGLTLSEGGVQVDAALRTSDPDIFAVGDIAAAENPVFGSRIRTEHWANALKQPAVAAAGMLGRQAIYDELPYFFTDQYDLGMEYVGHSAGYQRVVFRGDPDRREFTAFWLGADNRVLAGMNVNIWEGLDDIKAVVRSGLPVDVDALADPGVKISELR